MDNDIWSGLDHKSEQERRMWGLFSFEGKMRRQGWWGYGYLGTLIISLIIMVPLIILGAITGLEILPLIGNLVLLIPLIWISLATTVKRLRSMDYSPWLVLLMLVPIANIVLFIMINVIAGKNHREDVHSAQVFQ